MFGSFMQCVRGVYIYIYVQYNYVQHVYNHLTQHQLTLLEVLSVCNQPCMYMNILTDMLDRQSGHVMQYSSHQGVILRVQFSFANRQLEALQVGGVFAANEWIWKSG